MPTADRDSSPEPSDKPDSPMDDEVEEVEEEIDDERDEEFEYEEEAEEIGEEEKGDEEEEQAEDEEEEEEEVEEEEQDEEAAAADEKEEAWDEEETEDASKKLESEGHEEELRLSPGMSESNHSSPTKDVTDDFFVAHNSSVKIRAANGEDPGSSPGMFESDHSSPGKDVTDDFFVAHNSSVKIHAENSEETSNTSVRPAVQGKSTSERCPESQGDGKEIVCSLEKKTSGEEPELVKNFDVQTHGSSGCHLSSGGSISSDINAPLHIHSEGLVEKNITEGVTMVGKSRGIHEKEVSYLDPGSELKIPKDPSLSSIHTPEKRPRSSSPSCTPENLSKKPALICSFYARGWCIKGSSCRFLHQKEGSEEDLATPSRKEDVLDGTGSAGEAERLIISSSQERSDPSITENSSKSHLQMQRALVRAYGEESHGPAYFHDGEELHKFDTPRVGDTLTQGEIKSRFGLGSGSDHMNERGLSKEHLLSTRCLHEEQLQQELPKRELPSDSPFPKKSSIVPEDRYYSGSSYMSSGLFINNSSPFAHGRRTEDASFRDHQSNFPPHDSQSSYSLSGSVPSAFNSSYQPAPGSSFGSERLEIQKKIDFGNERHGSRSSSLPRSSSPYFSRPELVNSLHRNVPRDLPASLRLRIEAEENSWEPSIPFRPSFHFALSSLASPGSQYDPLLDSIEPRNTGNVALQASERDININIPDRTAPLLSYRNRIPEHNPHRPGLNRSKPADGANIKTSLAATPEHDLIDGGHNFAPKEGLDPIAESADVNGTEHGSVLRYQGGKGMATKESKAMKIFRATLIDFVKELVKPSWREGHLSKDAHKKVVKKAVEKVLSALPAHQVPDTTESINQYLSTSRPKILKLVEGYVEKYSKS